MRHPIVLATSLALLVISSALNSAGTQPATNPQDDPRSTTIAFLRALAEADTAAARQLIVVDDDAGMMTIKAYAGFQRANRDYNQAVMARWNKDASRTKGGLAFNEMEVAFTKATLRVDGDDAHLSADKTDAFFQLREMHLRRVNGIWKVDIGGHKNTRSIAQANSRMLNSLAAAIDTVTTGVKGGKYESPDLAGEAYEEALKDALVNTLRPAPPPAPQAGTPQERAVARIRQLGGTYEVDEKLPGRPVVKVVLNYTPATDADMELLNNLASLREVHLNETRITDAGVKHLTKLAELRILHMNLNKLTDAGVEQLTALTRLEELGLSGTKVTDASFQHLAKLTSLQRLYISHTKVTDPGLATYVGLKNLKLLCVSGEGITDANLAKLRQQYPDMEVRK